jgi:hypothetical protein
VKSVSEPYLESFYLVWLDLKSQRMAAVIHHCGSGTLAACLQAGVPNMALPLKMDQFYWGRRIHELGVGPAFIQTVGKYYSPIGR